MRYRRTYKEMNSEIILFPKKTHHMKEKYNSWYQNYYTQKRHYTFIIPVLEIFQN